MAPVRTAASLVLLACLLGCRAAPPVDEIADAVTTTPTASTTDPTAIPSPPTGPTPPPDVIDVQEQVYIITGIFLAFTIFLLAVTLVSAYVIIGLRHKIKRLEAGGGGGGPPSPAAPRRKPTQTRRPTPGPPPARDNRAFAPDEHEEDDIGSYEQFPESERAGSIRERQYDRFHKPMPDSYLPPEEPARGRRDDNSRYGAGNLARLSKGPAAPPPSMYESRYSDERGRRPQSHSQW